MTTTTIKKMKISLTLNGFHGHQTRNVLAEIQKNENYTGDEELDCYSVQELPYVITISESAAKKFSCSCSDCTCGEGMSTEIFATQLEVDRKSVEVPGNYPQR